jgi:putative FmdB family regulatory protein
MPLYEYQCLKCGRRTEILQRFADAPLAVCPECGGEVKKLVSSPAFQFKGSGWYATDYAKKSGSDSSSEPKSEAKSEGKADEGGKADKAEKADKPKEATAPVKSSSSAGSE